MLIKLKGVMTVEMMASRLLDELVKLKATEVVGVNLYVTIIGHKEKRPGDVDFWQLKPCLSGTKKQVDDADVLPFDL